MGSNSAGSNKKPEKYPNQRKVSKSEKSTYIREKIIYIRENSLHQRILSKSEKSLYIREKSPNQRKVSRPLMLIPSKPNDVRLLLLLLSLLLKHSLNLHHCQIHYQINH